MTQDVALFVENLTVIDSSYLCAKRGIVGESWIVDVMLHGALNEISMVMDFGKVKKAIKQAIDASVDHTLIVPREATQEKEGRCVFLLETGESIYMTAPKEAYSHVEGDVVTDASLIALLQKAVAPILPANVKKIDIALRHEAISGAYYHYSHGLKKHDGNCQRIAHGHRSKICITKAGARQTNIEQQWADRLNNIYIVSQEDILSDDGTRLETSYSAPQGTFYLSLPKRLTYIIDTDSTVECIAAHIAAKLPGYDVRAYEGVGKGAVAGGDLTK